MERMCLRIQCFGKWIVQVSEGDCLGERSLASIPASQVLPGRHVPVGDACCAAEG